MLVVCQTARQTGLVGHFRATRPVWRAVWLLLPLPLAGEGGGEGWPVQTKRAHIQDFQQQRVWPKPRGHGYIPLPNPLPQAGEGVKPAPMRPLFEPSLRQTPPSATINCPPDGPYRPFSCHKPRLAGSLVFASRLDWRWHMVKTRNKQTPSAPSAVTPAKAGVHNSAPPLSFQFRQERPIKNSVIPAQAGIQRPTANGLGERKVDSGLRRNDGYSRFYLEWESNAPTGLRLSPQ